MRRGSTEGFTLIELIVVIVIVAIVALTAAPQFLSFQSDARSSAIKGLSSALRTGSDFVHSKAVIERLDSGSTEMEINGKLIRLRGGYPRVAANCNRFTADLEYWVDLTLSATCLGSESEQADWHGVVSANQFHFFPQGYDDVSQNCFVTYTTASQRIDEDGDGDLEWVDTDSANIEYETSGC